MLKAALGFLVFLILLGSLIFFKPHLVINEATLNIAQKILKQKNIDFSWKSFNSTGGSDGFLSRFFSYSFEGLCLGLNTPSILADGCLDELTLAFKFEFRSPVIRVLEIGPIKMKGQNFKLQLNKTEEPSEPKSKSNFLRRLFPKDLASLKVNQLDIDIKDANLLIYGNPLTLSAYLDSTSEQMPYKVRGTLDIKSPDIPKMHASLEALLFDKDGKFHDVKLKSDAFCIRWKSPVINGCLDQFDLGAKIEKTDKGYRISELLPVNIDLRDTDIQFGTSRFQGGLKTNGQLGKAGSLSIQTNFEELGSKLKGNVSWKVTSKVPDTIRITGPTNIKTSAVSASSDITVEILNLQSFEYRLPIKLLSGPTVVNANLDGHLDSEKTGGQLRGTVENKGLLLRLSEGCHYDVTFEKNYLLNCPFRLLSKSEGLLQDIRELPTQISGRLTADFKTLEESEEELTGEAKLNLDPIKNDLLDVTGNVDARVDKFKMDTDALLDKVKLNNKIHIRVLDFRKLTRLLSKTSLAIPAPLNVMRGELSFESEGSYLSEKDEIPFSLKTDLSSAQQFLKTEFNGRIGLITETKKVIPHLTVDAILTHVQLALPRLGIQRLPQITPDPRIKPKVVNVTPKNEKPTFLYNISVSTPDTQPLTLLSDLAKGPIPIGLKLKIETSKAPTGQIAIKEFPLEIFRRNAKVSYLTLNLTQKNIDDDPIDGKLVITYADYKISVILSGTVKRPHVKFESEPFLREDQVIAVILFGKVPEDLAADEGKSATNMRAALADRALALTSLYYLASTPIESIGYDGQQKMFTAKFKIQEGVSLDIGTGSGGLQQIGINKRLSNSWFIRTYVTNPNESDEQSVTTFLEKYFRY